MYLSVYMHLRPLAYILFKFIYNTDKILVHVIENKHKDASIFIP